MENAKTNTILIVVITAVITAGLVLLVQNVTGGKLEGRLEVNRQIKIPKEEPLLYPRDENEGACYENDGSNRPCDGRCTYENDPDCELWYPKDVCEAGGQYNCACDDSALNPANCASCPVNEACWIRLPDGGGGIPGGFRGPK